MLPNTLGPVIVAVMFGIPLAIFAEAALGFIGFERAAADGQPGPARGRRLTATSRRSTGWSSSPRRSSRS